MANLTTVRPPPGAVMLPDEGRYKMRMDIPSSDGSRYYRVAYNISGWFCCSCRGCIRHGQCKHLSAMGLWGKLNADRALARAREIGLL